MPSARPSVAYRRALYDKLGDTVTDELVSWFNEVDLTYRTQLRELNELNFARFDAKVGERMAKLRASIEGVLNQVRDAKTSMIKWMFGFWIGTALVILGSRFAQ